MPIQVIVQSELPEPYAMRGCAMEAPAPQLVFGNVNRRHRPNPHVVQRNGDGSSDLVAATNPCCGDRQQRLERVKRSKTEKYSNGRTKCNGVRRVRDGHQRHVVRDQPALESRQWSKQSRFVNRLRRWL